MLASHGAKVVVNDLGGEPDGTGADPTPAQHVAAEIAAMGGDAIVNGDDVSDFDGAKRMIDQKEEDYRRIFARDFREVAGFSAFARAAQQRGLKLAVATAGDRQNLAFVLQRVAPALLTVAGVPIGDYAMGYDELSPLLQAYDRALLGGKTPREMPELMSDRSPINFADRVKAPVLFLIGENDSRCPYGQAMAYVEELAARGHPHEVYTYGTGHASFDVDERVRQVGAILGFLRRTVPGIG